MQTAPKDPYVKVEGAPSGQQESIPAPTLIAAAYGFIWLFVVAFVVATWRRNQALSQELDQITSRLDGLERGRNKPAA